MPADNGSRFDDYHNAAPIKPKPAKQNPKYSIPGTQMRAGMSSVQYAKLLAQGKNFKTEVIPRTEKHAKTGQNSKEQFDHEAAF